MQAVLLTFKYFQRADKNKLQNKVHSLKFSMVDSSLILYFALQEIARSCWGLTWCCTHCCMRIICTDKGATHMRAVSVDKPAAGGRLGQVLRLQLVLAVCSGWSAPRRPARALPVFGRWRQRWLLMCACTGRGQAPAPALVADA